MADAKSEEKKTVEQKTETTTEVKKGSSNSTLKIVLIIVGVLVGLIVLGWLIFFLVIGAIFKKASDSVDYDNDGNITIHGEDGTTLSGGENADLPDGFPSDVAIYEPSTNVFSLKTEDKNYSVTLRTPDDPSKVKEFYTEKLAKDGWATGEDTYELTFENGGFSKSYTKDNRTLNLSVTQDDYGDDNGNTTINLVITVNEE